MIEVGVDGLTIDHSPGSPISGGSFTVTSVPSTKLIAEGKGAYRGPLTFTFSGGNMSGMVPGSVTGGGTINPTATKMSDGGLFVIREGDAGTLIGTAVPTGGGSTPVSGDVEVTDPAQTKLRAN